MPTANFAERQITGVDPRLTKAQKKAIRELKRRFFAHVSGGPKFWTEKKYKFDSVIVSLNYKHRSGKFDVSLFMSARMRDERCVGSMFPTRLHVFIGPNGGLSAFKEDKKTGKLKKSQGPINAFYDGLSY